MDPEKCKTLCILSGISLLTVSRLCRCKDDVGGGFGLVINLTIGIVGSVLGGWLFSLFGMVAIGFIGSLITDVVGEIVLLWITSLLQTRSKD